MPKICVFVSVNVHVSILHEKHQNRRKSLKRARDLEKRQRSYQGIISLEEKPKNDLYSTKVQSMTKKTYDQSLKLCQAKSFKIELIDNISPLKPLETESTSILQVTSSSFYYLMHLLACLRIEGTSILNVKV